MITRGANGTKVSPRSGAQILYSQRVQTQRSLKLPVWSSFCTPREYRLYSSRRVQSATLREYSLSSRRVQGLYSRSVQRVLLYYEG